MVPYNPYNSAILHMIKERKPQAIIQFNKILLRIFNLSIKKLR